MKDGLCHDGVGRHETKQGKARPVEAGRGEERPGDDHRDLTVSVFLRGDFLRALEGHDYEAGQGALAASVEGCVRSLYPAASVSVRAAELLDGDWEVEVGELGRGRMGGEDRADIERHVRAAVGETIARFH